jgi:predicted small metal-binding protein
MHADDNDGAQSSPAIARRRQAVARQVKCECGYVARAQTDQEVLTDIRDHIRSDHPELVDEISDEQIIDWIEVVD